MCSSRNVYVLLFFICCVGDVSGEVGLRMVREVALYEVEAFNAKLNGDERVELGVRGF